LGFPESLAITGEQRLTAADSRYFRHVRRPAEDIGQKIYQMVHKLSGRLKIQKQIKRRVKEGR
jgi:hypothetical protein